MIETRSIDTYAMGKQVLVKVNIVSVVLNVFLTTICLVDTCMSNQTFSNHWFEMYFGLKNMWFVVPINLFALCTSINKITKYQP